MPGSNALKKVVKIILAQSWYFSLPREEINYICWRSIHSSWIHFWIPTLFLNMLRRVGAVHDGGKPQTPPPFTSTVQDAFVSSSKIGAFLSSPLASVSLGPKMCSKGIPSPLEQLLSCMGGRRGCKEESVWQNQHNPVESTWLDLGHQLLLANAFQLLPFFCERVFQLF